MFAMGVLNTTAQTMNKITIIGVTGTQDPPVIPVWTLLCVRGSRATSRANDFGTRSGYHEGFAVDLALTTAHEMMR